MRNDSASWWQVETGVTSYDFVATGQAWESVSTYEKYSHKMIDGICIRENLLSCIFKFLHIVNTISLSTYLIFSHNVKL